MSSIAPTFSVLCASFNHARFVVEALDSVSRQTCRDFEIVFVDDGSTDDTPARFESWRQGFTVAHPNPVRGIRTVNGGQSAALEAGFHLCRGRYIALLDSDDRWLPGKLAAVAVALDQHQDCGLFVHPQIVIDASGARTGDVRPKGAQLSSGDLRDQMQRTGRHVAGATSCHTYRAELFANLLPMPTKQFPSAADQYLSFGASLMEPVFALSEPLSEYRVHPSGHYIRRMCSPEGIRQQLELQRTIVAHFGLSHVMNANSFFARNSFAVAKLSGGAAQQVRAYLVLAHAIWADAAFRSSQKVALSAFWSVGLLAPRSLFLKQWTWFQRKQTGRDRVRSPEVSDTQPTPT